ncbi:unnamed protein product [Rotaria sordida]|uniref:G-protein coupled receptors family 1 profile domain-containing protein n=1 Tax=Rotaria sordida TaxID=392033 RepID=A0A815HIH5_9BILA|nr:unnamed protein product [Rotaria sordida]CAF4204213.1 unnamed protein product [Rotaria sordida]
MNSSRLNVESWFIPIDILNIICNSLIIELSSVLLFVLALDKICHTASMMLIGNTCLSALMSGCCMLSMYLNTLKNDLKQIQFQDSLCIFQAYITYVSGALFMNSLLLQAIHRYFTAIYRTRLYFQSIQCQFLIIYLTWIFASLHPVPVVFIGAIHYDADNQMCQIHLEFSFSTIYMSLRNYGIPTSFITFIYFQLIRYIHQMSTRVIHATTLFRAKKELKMVQYTVILVVISIILGFP